MTLKQLETFYWVCRLGSFVAAAERLHSTQSAVSMRIQDLERSLGVVLFDRALRSTRPTPKGQELLRYVERLTALTSEIQHRLADPQVLTGTVRLGVTDLVAVTWLSDLVTAINEKYPGVTVELDVDLTLNQLEKLDNGNIDMALLPGPIAKAGLAHVPLGQVEFAWMASPKLGIPKRHLTPRDLDAWPLLTLSRKSNLHNMLGTWFEQSDATARRTDVCNSIGVLSVLTIAGLGVSYLPHGYFTEEVERGQLQILDVTPRLPPLQYYAVFDRRKSLPFAETIADLARTHSSFHKPNGGARKHRRPANFRAKPRPSIRSFATTG